jgi:predicted exporter
VSRLLRSTDLQKRALESVPRASLLTKRIHESLNKAGFVPEAFPDLEAEFQNQPAPLTWADLETTPLHKILAPFVLSAKDEFVVVTALRDVRDEAGLKAAVASIPGLDYFSQRAVLDQAYSDLRARTTHLLLLGLLLVGAAAFARYRNARRALAAILPALLAACSTLGWLALAGEEVHLLHILGLLLACSMGVDYGVFLVDTTKDSVGAALLSICIGCLSTILSFGALSLSSAPALHALGTTITSGVFLSLILAPTTFLFLKARSATTTEEPS